MVRKEGPLKLGDGRAWRVVTIGTPASQCGATRAKMVLTPGAQSRVTKAGTVVFPIVDGMSRSVGHRET